MVTNQPLKSILALFSVVCTYVIIPSAVMQLCIKRFQITTKV